MPTKKTCFERMFEHVENQSHRCPRSQFKFKTIGMNHRLEGKNRIGLGLNWNGVSDDQGSEDGRSTRRTKRMNGREFARELQLSLIH